MLKKCTNLQEKLSLCLLNSENLPTSPSTDHSLYYLDVARTSQRSSDLRVTSFIIQQSLTEEERRFIWMTKLNSSLGLISLAAISIKKRVRKRFEGSSAAPRLWRRHY